MVKESVDKTAAQLLYEKALAQVESLPSGRDFTFKEVCSTVSLGWDDLTSGRVHLGQKFARAVKSGTLKGIERCPDKRKGSIVYRKL